MRDNWVIETNVSITAERIFGIITSFLGCNGSEGTLEQISARCRPAAIDCINAAIQEVNRINFGITGNDISPSSVSAFETSVTAIGSVVYSLLPIKAAELLAVRYDMQSALFLKKLYDTTFQMYRAAIPAEAAPITEVY